VLVGGLGMGFTLRATLDLLPKNFEGRDRAAPHANHYQEAPRAALKKVSNVHPKCFSGTAADGRLDETYRVANHHSGIGTRAVAGHPPSVATNATRSGSTERARQLCAAITVNR
jgi:hypothetical protein